MKEETRTLVAYRLERARESLEEAKLLLDRGYGNTFVNCNSERIPRRFCLTAVLRGLRG